VEAGYITTQTGPGGGLTLTCDPAKVTMLDIVELLEGPVCLNNCLLRPKECPRDHICPAHNLWGRLQFLIISELRAATLESLAAEYVALRHLPRPKGHFVHDLPLIATQQVELSSIPSLSRKD
jgi:DNA-binding IscR family transcriptional regulator